MNSKIFSIIILSLLPGLSSCGSDARADSEGSEKPIECSGFFSPGINIFVRDSFNEGAVIDSATVSVRSSDGESELYENPVYVQGEDGLSNSLSGAYYSELNFNSSIFEISIVVSADGYHTFVTKGIEFEVHTSCGSENDLIYDVYLCPLETTCI